MKHLIRSFSVACCLFFLNLAAVAQQLPFVHYPPGQLRSETVLAFRQNNNKEVEYITETGLHIFNGRAGRRILEFDVEGLENVQQALFGNEEVWVLAENGLFVLPSDHNSGPGKIEKVREGGIDKIFYSPVEKRLYYRKDRQLFLLETSGADKIVLKEVEEVENVFFGEESLTIVGEKKLEVYNRSGERVETIRPAHPIVDTYQANDRLLILTSQGVFVKEQEVPLKQLHVFNELEVSTILEDKAGRVWVGTKNRGLLLIDGDRRRVLGFEENFPLSGVEGIYESRDYSVWFYGKEGIAYRSFSTPFQQYHLGKHLEGDQLQDLRLIDSTTAVLLTRDGYKHLFRNELADTFTHSSLSFTPAFSSVAGPESVIYASRQGKIRFIHQGKNYNREIIEEIRELFAFEGKSILLTSEGNVYSFDYTTYQLKKKNWKVAKNGPLTGNNRFMLYTNEQGELRLWDSRDERHHSLSVKPSDIRKAALSGNGELIYLTMEGELKHASVNGVKEMGFKLPHHQEPSGLNVSANHIWISAGNHLYQLTISKEEAGIRVSEPVTFNAMEEEIQLPLIEVTETAEGNFLLASENSLVIYNPLSRVPDISAPGLVPDQLFVKSRDSLRQVDFLSGDTTHLMMAEEDQLLINAFAVNYDRSNRSELEYRFSASGDQWKPAMNKDLILLSGLPAGKHMVELASKNEQGVRSKKRVILSVVVNETPWYNWWAVAGTSVGMLFICFLAFNGIKSVKEGKNKVAGEKYEKELLKLQRRSHEQRMKAEGLQQINELISAQKAELEDKNKQIVAQKYELSLTSNQIKQQKDLIEKTSEKLQNSINYAKRIQAALMGDEIRIKEDLTDSFVFFKPRDQVSGDFFWYEKALNEEGEEVWVIAAVDCTGHGVPGAIVSVVGIQLLNAIVHAKGITDPGQILTQLNIDLLNSLKYEQTRINDGMDMSLCTINPHRKKINFAGAKNPLYIVENGELEIIKGDKQPIGGKKLKEEKNFQTHEILLDDSRKKMFYLFSDGYQDQFGGADKSKFMSRNFKNLLVEISEKPMIEQKYLLAKTISEWQGEEEQTDDILVMGFKI